jgi:transcriptional regulator with XRE-family HTH domain
MTRAGTNSLEAFGAYLRSQRRLARLTLRELSELTKISNPYLSQVERGLHQPSINVIKSLANALNVSAEALLAQAAGLDDDPRAHHELPDTERAIRNDPLLSEAQKAALLSVYRSFIAGEEPSARAQPTAAAPRPTSPRTNGQTTHRKPRARKTP